MIFSPDTWRNCPEPALPFFEGQDQCNVDVEDVKMNNNHLVQEDEKGKDIRNYDIDDGPSLSPCQ